MFMPSFALRALAGEMVRKLCQNALPAIALRTMAGKQLKQQR